MNNRERMLKGLVYDPTAGDIMGDQQACNEIMSTTTPHGLPKNKNATRS